MKFQLELIHWTHYPDENKAVKYMPDLFQWQRKNNLKSEMYNWDVLLY